MAGGQDHGTGITLWQGDCLELMQGIPDGGVDMVLCDLPYGVTACKWDTRIPFEPMWEQYKRIVKRTGAICLFCTEPFATRLRYSNMEMYRYDWVWKKRKTTGFQHAKNMPLRDYETISVFSRGRMGHRSLLGDNRMEYNPQGLVPCEITEDGAKKFGGIVGARPSHKSVIKREFTGYPRMVIEFASETGRHPTQKPVPLLEYLIKTYTTEGETVLDNCMGSGSTGVACVNTGRNFIGIELDAGYFEAAKKWITDRLKNRG